MTPSTAVVSEGVHKGYGVRALAGIDLAVPEGHDVVHDAAALRSVIGLAGQDAAVDENLTGRENLPMVGRVYHLSK